MSVIMDACDQTDIDCPYFQHNTGAWSNSNRIQLKMGAVLIHGADTNPGAGLYLYPVDDRTVKGQNYWATVLVDALGRYKAANNGSLPPRMYLQMDSSSENKNWSVAALSQWLVESGLFNKVKCSFLPVGHTHEDIDANFGRMSQAMRKTNCFTWADVLEVCIESVNRLTRGIFQVGVRFCWPVT
jgi:hypothetical protein